MKKIYLILFLGIFLAGAISNTSAATINSVSGNIADGESVVISGNNFGTKSTAAPLLWETFEDGSDGSDLHVVSSNWEANNGGADYSSTTAYSGSLSAHNSVTNGDDFDSSFHTFTSTDKFYFSCMFKATGDPYDSGVGKNSRVTSSGEPYRGVGVTGMSQNAVFYDPEDGGPWEFPCMYDEPSPDCSEEGNGRYFMAIYDDVWTRQTMYVELSSPGGTANGYMQFTVGAETQTFINLVNRQTGQTFEFTQLLLGLMHDDDDHELYMDDVYIDNTRARVEIGNNPDFSLSTHNEIQIPQVWADGSITVEINQGSFADGETAYMFVVDSDGNVSVGEEIVFADGAPAETLGPTFTSYTGCLDPTLDTEGKSCVELNSGDCPGTLSDADTYYLLMTDLVHTGSMCARIGATNITFDLNTHTISFDQTPIRSVIEVQENMHYAEIKNGIINETSEVAPASGGSGDAILINTCEECRFYDMVIDLDSFYSSAINYGPLAYSTIYIYNNNLSRMTTLNRNDPDYDVGIIDTYTGNHNYEMIVYNNILKGKAWMINQRHGEGAIYNNLFYPHKNNRNPYAVRISSDVTKGVDIINNTIIGENARGIFIAGADNCNIIGNFINVTEQRVTGVDDLDTSFGIRLRQYLINNTVENNTIFIKNGVNLAAVGLLIGPIGGLSAPEGYGYTGNVIRNNHITHIIDIDGTDFYDSYALGFQEYGFSENVIENNYLRSNRIGIQVGGGNGNSPSDGLFISNTIENISETSDFPFYALSFNRHGSNVGVYGIVGLINHTFINTSFVNNPGYDAVRYTDGSGPKQYIVKWFLDVLVRDNGVPASGQTVLIESIPQGTTTSPITQGDGRIPRQVIEEFNVTAINNVPGPREYSSPYNISVTHPVTGEVLSQTIDLNISQSLVFDFYSTANDPDVNSDGSVNVIDLAIVIFNQGHGLPDVDYGHLDIDGDGSLNWADVLFILLGI